ncbi:hypothetical protein JCM8115_001702 [Rhodotorula mucilaginosa]|uniref:ELYS-like domain-containing protein n=1 Tax=Rhodotorula mucilaginosa TaxID=5537 RepID=A0A9P7BAH4_RHOMI|nr:hypothetical protein C6P46_002622 [Rhodotorula mucilaginosa]TKA55184.1 hypothetical protein B0A53_02154 [Rhodotorula sp. CCFEE 5036]
MESSTESFVLVHPPASAAAAAAPPFVLPRAEVRTAILQHRLVQPDRSLAIDHLLALAAENLVQLYPPASESDLESLVAHLDALAAPDQAAPLVAKSCLYYLALALNADQDEEEAAEAHNYAENELLLPLPFRLAVRALVALDAGQHHLAVRWLAHPAVTPDFVPRTIAVLATVPEPAEDRAALVLDYYRLARLDLELYSVREAQYIVEALCAPERKRGVAQAWNLARDWPREHERPQLWTAILETCFGKNYTGLPCSQHLSTLLPLPFSPAEDSLVTSFCLSSSSTSASFLNPSHATLPIDWRLSKLVAESRSVDALEFFARAKHAFSQQADHRLDENDARDRLLKAVEANLTSVEKARLQLELASINSGAQPSNAAATTTTAARSNKKGSSTLATLTQPAWAPAPAIAADQSVAMDHDDGDASTVSGSAAVPAPAATPAPPRTLAELRRQRQPPAPAPAPTAADLPLSASPFVRRHGGPSAAAQAQHGRGGGSDVLRALQQQQQTPKKAAAAAGGKAFAGPLGVTNAAAAGMGSPFRLGALQQAGASTFGGTPSEQGASTVRSVATTTQTGAGSSAWAASASASSPATPKPAPTLPGFGSVRKPVAAASIVAAQQVAHEMVTTTPVPSNRVAASRRSGMDKAQQQQERRGGEVDEAEDEDAEMQGVEDGGKGERTRAAADDDNADDEAFARRAAKDPAVQRTIQAAASSSSSFARKAEEKGSGKRGATPARKTTRGRGDKRRAVQGQPPNEDKIDLDRTERVVGLPPGAFPGHGDGDEEEDEDSAGKEGGGGGPHDARSTRGGGGARGGAAKSSSRGTTRNASRDPVPQPATPARGASSRRTTRSRASTVEPMSPPPATGGHGPASRSTVSRRSTRASSVQAPDPSTNSNERETSVPPAPEMRQVQSGASLAAASSQGKTPVRRSSRLRTTGGGAGGGRGGSGKIDEASEEEGYRI